MSTTTESPFTLRRHSTYPSTCHPHIRPTLHKAPQCHAPSSERLCITDEASPLALRSTRIRPRRAVRRGAAWPAERPSSRLVVRERTHGWASQPAVARVVAREVRMPAVLSSPCPRSCLASGVQRPVRASGVHGACQVTGVRCRASEGPGVHCPASSVRRPVSVRCGVRCAQRERGRGRGVGRQPHGWDGPESAWSPAVSTGRASSARGWSLTLEAGAGRAGPAEGRLGLGLGRRRGKWLAVGPGRPGGRPR
jgi:hypothetical protein